MLGSPSWSAALLEIDVELTRNFYQRRSGDRHVGHLLCRPYSVPTNEVGEVSPVFILKRFWSPTPLLSHRSLSTNGLWKVRFAFLVPIQRRTYLGQQPLVQPDELPPLIGYEGVPKSNADDAGAE
jgi:hypothetical protein